MKQNVAQIASMRASVQMESTFCLQLGENEYEVGFRMEN